MLFHSEFEMIPRRQGGSSGGVYENTLSMLTTQLTQVGLEYGMESTYDNIYRLTQATPTGGSYQDEAYTYDNVGNRLTKTNEETPNINETTTYGYDDENRLTGVQITQNNQTKQIIFAYDPFGRRIKKTVSPSGGGVGEEITTYVYDNQNIILEYDNSNNIRTRYTHGPNIDEPLAIEIKGTTTFTPYYYHADGLGSITALTDTNGSIVQRYEYDSFGNQTITTNGNITQPYTYTAREYDTETNMYFYRARYYDSKAGRFVTKDPIGFDGGDVNLYAYVKNNPILYIDPMGMACGTWWNDWAIPDALGGYNFSDCCQKHDDCYEGKNNQCNKNQKQCDDEFYQCMRRVCDYKHLSIKQCYSNTSKYWYAVRRLGDGPFKAARKKEPCCQN